MCACAGVCVCVYVCASQTMSGRGEELQAADEDWQAGGGNVWPCYDDPCDRMHLRAAGSPGEEMKHPAERGEKGHE